MGHSVVGMMPPQPMPPAMGGTAPIGLPKLPVTSSYNPPSLGTFTSFCYSLNLDHFNCLC